VRKGVATFKRIKIYTRYTLHSKRRLRKTQLSAHFLQVSRVKRTGKLSILKVLSKRTCSIYKCKVIALCTFGLELDNKKCTLFCWKNASFFTSNKHLVSWKLIKKISVLLLLNTYEHVKAIFLRLSHDPFT
jgi:hypothetical protein